MFSEENASTCMDLAGKNKLEAAHPQRLRTHFLLVP